jgi:hypothetical protein
MALPEFIASLLAAGVTLEQIRIAAKHQFANVTILPTLEDIRNETQKHRRAKLLPPQNCRVKSARLFRPFLLVGYFSSQRVRYCHSTVTASSNLRSCAMSDFEISPPSNSVKLYDQFLMGASRVRYKRSTTSEIETKQQPVMSNPINNDINHTTDTTMADTKLIALITGGKHISNPTPATETIPTSPLSQQWHRFRARPPTPL